MAWGLGSMVRRQAWLPRLSQGSLGRRAYCVFLGGTDAVGPSASGEEPVGQEGPRRLGMGSCSRTSGGEATGGRWFRYCSAPLGHPNSTLLLLWKQRPFQAASRVGGISLVRKPSQGGPALARPLCVPGSGFAAPQTLPTPTPPPCPWDVLKSPAGCRDLWRLMGAG